MTNLDTIQSNRGERLDSGTSAGAARVRENGQSARRMDHRDRVPHRQALLRDECRATIAEVPVEGIAEIGRPAVVYERAGG